MIDENTKLGLIETMLDAYAWDILRCKSAPDPDAGPLGRHWLVDVLDNATGNTVYGTGATLALALDDAARQLVAVRERIMREETTQ